MNAAAKIIAIAALFLCANAEVQGKKGQTCEKLLREYAANSSHFIQCTIDYGVPVMYCLNCAGMYQDLKTGYDNLLNGNELLKNATEKKCFDIYFNQDRLNIVSQSHEVLTNFWSEAFCRECIDSNGTVSDETKAFYQFNDKYQACQTKSKDFCVDCKGFYVDLNNEYKDITKNKQICFDIQDSMNRTRTFWTQTCGHDAPKASLVAFAAVSSTLTSIPILFYCGFFIYYRRREENHQTIDAQNTERENPEPSHSGERLWNVPSTSTGFIESNSTLNLEAKSQADDAGSDEHLLL